MPVVNYSHSFDEIIDHLVDHGWVIVENFLSADEVHALRLQAIARRAAGDFHRAAVGRGDAQSTRDDIRGDSVLWLDPQSPHESEMCYWQRIDQLQATLNRTLYLGIREGEFHYAYYPVGRFYKRHLDRFRDDDARTVSVVCYLNEDWQAGDGGELRLYLDGEAPAPYVDIQPKAGCLALFMSDRFWHEVLPAQRERWSLTGWLRRAGR